MKAVPKFSFIDKTAQNENTNKLVSIFEHSLETN